MIALVSGGSCSGKSEYAERLACAIAEETGAPRCYLATLMAYDEESFARIRRHREMRKDRQFITRECYTNLPAAEVPEGSVVLLDCVSNLVANEMFTPDGAGENAAGVIMEGISRIAVSARALVVVSDEVFADGVRFDESTEAYRRILAEVARLTAEQADLVVECAAGLPLIHKGVIPRETAHALERL